MKKYFNTLLIVALALCFCFTLGCDKPQNDTVDDSGVVLGEICEYLPFGEAAKSTQKLEIVGDSNAFKIIGGYEIMAVEGGTTTIRATYNGETAEKQFSVLPCTNQIVGSYIYLHPGEPTFLFPVTTPIAMDNAEYDYSVISGNSVTVTGNKVDAVGTGESIILVRDKSSKRAALFTVISLNHSVNLNINLKTLPVGGKANVNPVFTDNIERDLVFETVYGSDVIKIDDYAFTGLKRGVAIVKTSVGNEIYYFEIEVTGWDIVFSDVTLYVGSGITLNPTSDPAGAYAEYTFNVESGDCVTFDGAVMTAVKEGTATVKCTDSITGKTAVATVTVLARKPIIHIDDLTVAEGDSVLINPQVENLESYMTLTYTVTAGSSSVRVENGRVYGLTSGSATIVCSIPGTDATKTVTVTVEKIGYTLSVNGLRIKEGESASPEPALIPSRDNTTFIYTVLYGADFIEVDGTILRGVKEGQAVVRCSVEGLSVYYDFAVIVRSATVTVPTGYVQITPYIYASVAGGRFKTAQTVDFFTTLPNAKIYYTSDSSAVKTDLSNAKEWRSSQYVKERKGLLSEYTLMQQVDGILAWSGEFKNTSYNYVNNVQNSGQYPLINLGYVFNVAVVSETGDIVDKTVQSYIIFAAAEFNDVPIISLSMDENSWFDGIENGLGTSIYNNVYLPGTNVQAEYTARVNMEFFDTTGSFSVNSQVKIGGGWSRGRPQRTLHLNFNKDENGNKQEEVHFEIFGDRTCLGSPTKTLNDFSRFRLWNGGSSYEDWIRFNDAYLQLLAADLNVSTTAVRPAIVYLNGEFWGMYYLREHYSSDYFKENYKVKKSNVQYFDYTGSTYNVSDGDEDAATAFIADMNAFLNDPTKNFADDDVYKQFTDVYVDEASLIDMLIMQAYSGNWDFVGNGNNHRLWRVSVPEEGNVYTDGKLRFCLHDLDMGLTGDITLNGDYANLLSYSNGFTYRKNTLINRCLANEGFRERLYARALELAANELSYAVTSSKLSALSSAVRPILPYEITRWAQSQSVAQFDNNLNYAYSWLSRRINYFLPLLKSSMAIYDKTEEVPLSGGNIVYGEREFRVNQFWVGNGSPDAGRKQIRGLSVGNYEVSYTMINNGIRDMGAQFHMKLIYGNGSNDNCVTRFMRNDLQSLVFTDVKGMASSPDYYGVFNLYEGVHNVRLVKQNTTLTVYIDNLRAYSVAVPSNALTGIDVYQNNCNMIYRNFVIKSL